MADMSYKKPVDVPGEVAAKRPARSQDPGRTVLAGLLGGIATAVAYAVYQRLPDEQRDRLHGHVRSLIEARLNEFRDGLNL